MSPIAGLGVLEDSKNSCPCEESNPVRPAHTLVTIVTELSLGYLLKFEVLRREDLVEA